MVRHTEMMRAQLGFFEKLALRKKMLGKVPAGKVD